MGQSLFDNDPQTIVIGPRSTGTLVPWSIGRTPWLSITISKESDKNSLNGLALQTTNFSFEYQEDPTTGTPLNVRFPSGSTRDYLWYNEPDLYIPSGSTGASVPGVTVTPASATLAQAPFTTGSAVGAVTYHVQGINARFARLQLRSDSGGTFKVVAFGKD